MLRLQATSEFGGALRESHECGAGVLIVEERVESSPKRFVGHVLGEREDDLDGGLGQGATVDERVAGP